MMTYISVPHYWGENIYNDFHTMWRGLMSSLSNDSFNLIFPKFSSDKAIPSSAVSCGQFHRMPHLAPEPQTWLLGQFCWKRNSVWWSTYQMLAKLCLQNLYQIHWGCLKRWKGARTRFGALTHPLSFLFAPLFSPSLSLVSLFLLPNSLDETGDRWR